MVLARGLCVGILVTIVAMFFVEMTVYSWLIIVLTLLMTTATFALGGLINAVFARSFDDSDIPTSF